METPLSASRKIPIGNFYASTEHFLLFTILTNVCKIVSPITPGRTVLEKLTSFAANQ
jgi:hypothetical protein